MILGGFGNVLKRRVTLSVHLVEEP
jgi:hypothetical protein